MRTLVERIHTGELRWMLLATALTTVIAIAARFLWTFPVAYVPRWMSKQLAARDPIPPWQAPFMVAFTGIRGVVSLAAALAIPMTTSDDRPFPHRDMFLFVTFGIIVITLVGQGLSLPPDSPARPRARRRGGAPARARTAARGARPGPPRA